MISISFLEFILFSLASFRLTRLIVFDTITTFIRKPFHEVIEETNEDGLVEIYLHVKGSGIKFWIGELLSCYWCVGVWTSLVLFFSYQAHPLVIGPIIIFLSIAALAAIIEALVSKLV